MHEEVRSTELDKSIEELEQLAFGTKEATAGDEGSAETTDSKVEQTTTEAQEVETKATVAEPPTPEKKDERNWESDYKTLRANSDQYKYVTRQELATLKERLIEANATITQLKSATQVPEKDLFKDTFSKEDVEVVGEDALSLMKKAATTAANAETAGIKEELQRERKLRLDAEKRGVVEDRAEASKIFRDRLASLVPEFNEINFNPDFEKFIKAADPINGGTRLTHFKNAENSGNVNTVAQYMKEFQATIVVPVDQLKDKVAPVGGPVATTVETNETLIPVSEVDSFYDEVQRGKFKGNMTAQKEQEAKYDLAFSKGLVDYNR